MQIAGMKRPRGPYVGLMQTYGSPSMRSGWVLNSTRLPLTPSRAQPISTGGLPEGTK